MGHCKLDKFICIICSGNKSINYFKYSLWFQDLKLFLSSGMKSLIIAYKCTSDKIYLRRPLIIYQKITWLIVRSFDNDYC